MAAATRKLNFRNETWTHSGKMYGPGEVELPEDLADRIEEKLRRKRPNWFKDTKKSTPDSATPPQTLDNGDDEDDDPLSLSVEEDEDDENDEEEDEDDEVSERRSQLTRQTKTELISIADETEGIVLGANPTRAQLIDAIIAAEFADDDEDEDEDEDSDAG